MSDISATEAARNFSRLLDDVERRRHSYTVSRGGREVASIIPAGPRSMTVGELLDRLRLAPLPDADFAADLADVRRDAGGPPEVDAWGS